MGQMCVSTRCLTGHMGNRNRRFHTVVWSWSGLTGTKDRPSTRRTIQFGDSSMRVSFYGKLASAIGAQLDVPIDGPCSVGGLRRHLVDTYPDVADALQDKRVKALIGETVVGDDYTISTHDEVEFLAPVSGG